MRKSWKQRIALVMAAGMLALGLAAVETPAPAFAGEMIDIGNGSFENGSDEKADAWGLTNDWTGIGGISTETVHEGNRSAYFNLQEGSGVNLFKSNNWTGFKYDPSQPMLLKLWVNYKDVTGDGFYVKLERKANDAPVCDNVLSVAKTGTSDGWELIEVYVAPVDVAEVQELIIGIEAAPGTGTVYIDDVTWETTERQSILRNPSLEVLNEDGTTLHWDVWPGNPAEGVRDFVVSTEVVKEGNQSLQINLQGGNPQAVYQYCVLDHEGHFDFNQVYTFSGYIKMENVMVFDGKGVTVGIKRRGVDGQEYNVYASLEQGTSDWTRFEITAPKAPVEIVQYDVIVDMGSGSGIVWMDGFDLVLSDEPVVEPEPTAAPEPTEEPTFEPEPTETPEATKAPEPTKAPETTPDASETQGEAEDSAFPWAVTIVAVVIAVGAIVAVVFTKKRK